MLSWQYLKEFTFLLPLLTVKFPYFIYTYTAETPPFAMNISDVNQILNKSSYQISSPGVLSQRH